MNDPIFKPPTPKGGHGDGSVNWPALAVMLFALLAVSPFLYRGVLAWLRIWQETLQ